MSTCFQFRIFILACLRSADCHEFRKEKLIGGKMGVSRAFLQKHFNELKRLEKEIEQAERLGEPIPEGSLRVSRIQGKNRYFFRNAGEKESRYIPAKEIDLVRRIAQKEYDRKLNKKILEQQTVIKDFVKRFDENVLEDLYVKQCQGRKELINPRIQTKEEFITAWYEAHPGNMNPYEKKESYTTEKGETVRSKSEKILADLFYRMGIPYQYETELVLGGRKIYPDFLLLNVKRRESLYWEHFGKIDDDDYAKKNFKRLADYEREGYLNGRDLLYSVESPEHPLNVKMVEQKLHWWMEG